MINILLNSLNIDITYNINSFIYTLRRLPILKNIITDNAYNNKLFKKIIYVIIVLFFLLRAIFLKFMYYFVIFYICVRFFRNNIITSFYHIYFVLTILGMFINNKLLNTTKKDYFTIFLFRVDSNIYFKSKLLYNTISNLILNSICIIFFNTIMSSPSIKYSIILILFTTFIRFIGEALNIIFYKKYNYIWYSNSNLYFTIILLSILLLILPIFNIYIPFKLIEIITIVITIVGILFLIYLLNIKDIRLIYKSIFNITNMMNSKNDKDYLKQSYVNIKKKDIEISSNITNNKSGLDYFNTIFYERHKEIILRTARKYSFILGVIYLILIILLLNNKYIREVKYLLDYRVGIFILIMYFINRGATITQAMFFNCDHAMLEYNFYKEKENIQKLFKLRLKMIIKVNLLPSTIIGISNTILLIILKDYNIILPLLIYIFTLSILFSVHYLSIYYLLQPFNKDLEVKSPLYSFVTLFIYMISFRLFNLVLNTTIMCLYTIIISVLIIIIELYLVYKLSYKTFKLK